MKNKFLIASIIIVTFITTFALIFINRPKSKEDYSLDKNDEILVKQIRMLNDEKTIFSNDLNNSILINYNNKMIPLNDVLADSNISLNDVLSKLSLIGILNDGGTKKYYNSDLTLFNKEFYIIVCNKNNIDKTNKEHFMNKNIYISENEDIYVKCSN